MKHRIAIDVSIIDRDKAGTNVYVTELVNAIKDIDPEDLILVILHGPRPVKSSNLLTSIINGLIRLFWSDILIPLLVLKFKIEVLHCPANTIPFYSPCKIVVTIHDATPIKSPETYNYWWRIYFNFRFRYAAKHADMVITISENSKKDIINYYGANPENTKVIYHGNRLLPVCVENNPPYGSYILFVGGAHPSKNIPRLIRAYHRFMIRNSTNSIYNLVIAGGNGLDSQIIRKLILELEISDRVFITGRISDNELSTLYKHAKLFAFPSLNEGFGFPPIEAMANDIPVITSAGGALQEICGDAAIYFDPLSVDDITDKIELTLTDADLRLRMIINGRSQAGKYSWRVCAENHLNIYREALYGVAV
jgi:glycosyltransferase involved in cell wall biosynthesis